MNKLFAFDMDGTIVDTNSNIIPETTSALIEARKKGFKTAIATGRPYSDIVRDVDSNLFDYLIANNGGYYYDVAKKEFVYENEVPFSMIDVAIQIGKENNCMFAVHAEKSAMRSNISKVVDLTDGPFEEWMKFDLTPIENIMDDIKGQRIMQVSLRSTKEVIEKIKPMFDKYADIVDIHIANEVYLDINPKGVSKLGGLKNVVKLLGMELKDVYAFGDSGNDLDMLQGAGLGVCMGNGSKDAKEAADVIIGDNNSTAIADKILELI